MIRRTLAGSLAVTALLAVATFAAAQTAPANTSPVGRWKTVDDKTGEFKAIVVITATAGGEIEGRIERVFSPPSPSAAPLCEKCEGALRNQPVVGMRFLWGFKADGKRFSGGRLLDPESGKVYKGTITVVDDGKKLDLRGFIGISLLGRTQTWLRE